MHTPFSLPLLFLASLTADLAEGVVKSEADTDTFSTGGSGSDTADHTSFS